MKIGLEREFWLEDKGREILLIPDSLPADGCGLLVEARGGPGSDAYDAVASLEADAWRIRDKLANDPALPGLMLADTSYRKVSAKLLLEALRIHGKQRVAWRNLYGHSKHANPAGTITAGLHVSFTDERYFWKKATDKSQAYNAAWDFPLLFKIMDNEFKREIRDSLRRPGFYEVKPDGRIEYRSLPSSAMDARSLPGRLAKCLKEAGL